MELLILGGGLLAFLVIALVVQQRSEERNERERGWLRHGEGLGLARRISPILGVGDELYGERSGRKVAIRHEAQGAGAEGGGEGPITRFYATLDPSLGLGLWLSTWPAERGRMRALGAEPVKLRGALGWHAWAADGAGAQALVAALEAKGVLAKARAEADEVLIHDGAVMWAEAGQATDERLRDGVRRVLRLAAAVQKAHRAMELPAPRPEDPPRSWPELGDRLGLERDGTGALLRGRLRGFWVELSQRAAPPEAHLRVTVEEPLPTLALRGIGDADKYLTRIPGDEDKVPRFVLPGVDPKGRPQRAERAAGLGDGVLAVLRTFPAQVYAIDLLERNLVLRCASIEPAVAERAVRAACALAEALRARRSKGSADPYRGRDRS